MKGIQSFARCVSSDCPESAFFLILGCVYVCLCVYKMCGWIIVSCCQRAPSLNLQFPFKPLRSSPPSSAAWLLMWDFVLGSMLTCAQLGGGL